MFTGITRGLFPIVDITYQDDFLTYCVAFNSELMQGLKIGDSIAIDGVCQSVHRIEDHRVTFNAIAETLSKTTLKYLTLGQKVSVERALRVGDELGGHILSGHVFETGVVCAKQESNHNLTLSIQCSKSCIQFIFTKGFIALDGSSLTVGDVDLEQTKFSVHLIPLTRELTNFDAKSIGSLVNIEIDLQTQILVEHINRILYAKMVDRSND